MPSDPYRFLITVTTPIARMIASLIGQTYSLLFGWFDKRLAREENWRLQRELERNLSFFFSTRNAQIIPAPQIKSVKDIDWPTLAVRVDGLVLKFVRWRGELQVYVTPAQIPNEWIELSLLLNLLDVPDRIDRRSEYTMSEVAGWLKTYLDDILGSYSPDRYPQLKARLAETQAYDRVVTKQWETEINRRLYPNK